MKKSLFLSVLLFFVLPSFVFAGFANYLQPVGGTTTLTGLFASLGNAIWIVFAIFALVCFVIAGIMFVTALGEASKIATAKASVIWGVVGIIVAILAYSIINIIENIF